MNAFSFRPVGAFVPNQSLCPTQWLPDSIGARSNLLPQKLRRLWMVVAVCSYLALVKSDSNTISAHSGMGKAGLGSTAGSSTGGGSNCVDDGCTDDGIASYTRFSSDQQDASSIGQQDAVIESGAKRNKHRINPDLKFFDEAVSGTKLDREGLNQLMKAAREKQIRVLYLYSLSRLARESLISLGILKELVHVHNVRVISVSENVDTDGGNWDLLATLFSFQHGQYIKVLSADVIRGQEYNIENDYSCGDWGFGFASEIIPGQESTTRFKKGKPRKRVIINQYQAEIVRLVFSWYVNEGRSINWIAHELTRLGIKKEHGGRTPAWHHNSVKLMLTNSKYIGCWLWGKYKNKRIPMTGQIIKELRNPEEYGKWTKQRPTLRIVDDALFFQAQDLLEKSAKKYDKSRGEKGRFVGTTNDHSQPRHLLQGAIKCGNCGGTFITYGGKGHRLHCTGRKHRLCNVKTTLNRDVAEEMLLNYVRERLLNNKPWLSEFMQDVMHANKAYRKANTDPTEEVERQISEVRRKIKKLIDMIETEETPDPSIKERLRERRVEQDRLERLLLLAKAKNNSIPEELSNEWILGKLSQLSRILQAEPARAGVALRNLLGPITVFVFDVPGSKRKRFEGRFMIDHTRIAQAALGFDGAEGMNQPEEVTLRFAPPPPWAALADQIKELWARGETAYATSKQLKCNYSWVAKGLELWHTERGLPVPSYGQKRQMLNKPSRPELLADDVKRMIDDDIPLKEIAKVLLCPKDTVTAAKKIWYERNGLPVPDGRTLRRLRNPNSRRRKAS